MESRAGAADPYPSPNITPTTPRFCEAPGTEVQRIHFNPQTFFVQRTRHRYQRTLKDNLSAAINKPSIRRLARRGGVKRIRSEIYLTAQQVVKARLKEILHHCVAICETRNQKTICTLDVIYALRVIGNPIYGFGTIVHGDEIKSRAEYMRERRAGYAANRRAVQVQLEQEAREAENRRIDDHVRRLGGSVNVRHL